MCITICKCNLFSTAPIFWPLHRFHCNTAGFLGTVKHRNEQFVCTESNSDNYVSKTLLSTTTQIFSSTHRLYCALANAVAFALFRKHIRHPKSVRLTRTATPACLSCCTVCNWRVNSCSLASSIIFHVCRDGACIWRTPKNTLFMSHGRHTAVDFHGLISSLAGLSVTTLSTSASK